jgi:HSP20 family protein
MPWDPVRDLLTMQERLDSLFGQAAPGWVPPAEVAEFGDEFRLAIELPGLTREDVTLDVTGNTVTVRGRRPPDGCPTERYQQLERSHGAFARTFHFGDAIGTDRIAADLVDGVLHVRIPKVPAAHPRQIDVE